MYTFKSLSLFSNKKSLSLNIFVLQNSFIRVCYFFNKHFYKNKKSKLYFGDRVAILNDFIYQTRGSRLKMECEMINVDGVFWCTKHIHYTLVWI
jgi:hypothetical protein